VFKHIDGIAGRNYCPANASMTMLSSGHHGSRADAAHSWVATRLLRSLPADRGFLVGKHCTDRSSTSKSSFSPSPNFTSAFRRAHTNPKRELPKDRCLSCTKCPGIVLISSKKTWVN
jgi:hypothetical protein